MSMKRLPLIKASTMLIGIAYTIAAVLPAILQGAIEAIFGLVVMVAIIGLCAGVFVLEISDAMATI